MSYICFENVKKEYKMGEVTIKAVDGVDFVIEKGEFAIIVGPSGAGKTTVLNMLGGMDACSGGTITVDGAKVSGYNGRQLTTYRRHDIGFVFQFYNLVQNLTALENVELALQICKDPLDANQVLEEVGLGERKGNFPAQLSGGEQQRVALVRGMINTPEILFADEPTGALNSKSTEAVLQVLTQLNQQGQSIVMVTHAVHAALRGNRILYLKDGVITNELTLKRYTGEEDLRRRKLLDFLQEMGW